MSGFVLLTATSITAGLHAQTVRDSAGVKIITVSIPKNGTAWKVSAKPTLEITPDNEGNAILFNTLEHPRRVLVECARAHWYGP